MSAENVTPAICQRPWFIAGDEVLFRYDGGEVVHVVTEAEAEAKRFKVPAAIGNRLFTISTRHRSRYTWSDAADFAEPDDA